MKSFLETETDATGSGNLSSLSSTNIKGPVTAKSPRFSANKEISPGPGSYTFEFKQLNGKKFPQSTRNDLFKSTESPGPGSYDVKNLNSAKSFVFPPKKKIQKTNGNPGPGTYNPKFIVKKNNNSLMSKAERKQLNEVSNTPGPGRYENPPVKSSPSWTIRKGKDTSFSSNGPGPGRYESSLNLSRSSCCVTLSASRPEVFVSLANPGPGSYENHDIKSSKIKYSFSKTKRPEKKNQGPGPGRYEVKNLSRSFSAKFGTAPRKNLFQVQNTPGPNKYKPKIVKDKGLSYSFSKKIAVKIGSEIPGPGAHTVTNHDNSQKIKFSTSMRFIKSYYEKDHMEKPGPGTYDSKVNLAVKFPVSKAKRVIHNINNNPGPGRY